MSCSFFKEYDRWIPWEGHKPMLQDKGRKQKQQEGRMWWSRGQGLLRKLKCDPPQHPQAPEILGHDKRERILLSPFLLSAKKLNFDTIAGVSTNMH